ncbi:hypothetical protein Rhe02_73100 [Rhizocola hellebori]|uniref:Uncharacterized protein n=1 Tax=Rhizocola hellebori TaxID=1392758 RepID=A0A8J3QE65_9ACTN|nr:hypothetical protein [Rhizocola hellebori]GIH09243.1 hypothetical protein Rhe02_73100 [Rhizocola hellebori]
MKISFWLAADPDGKSYGIGPGDWSHTLQRFREDLDTLVKGDTAHVFVPQTEVYILEISKNEFKASGKGWTVWRTAESPTPDSVGGMFFDPSSEWNLDGHLVYRPFAMLHDGEEVADANGKRWTFSAPFWFTDDKGQRGSPTWPLTVPGDHEKTKSLNDTSNEGEKARWADRARARPEVFGLEYPDW